MRPLLLSRKHYIALLLFFLLINISRSHAQCPRFFDRFGASSANPTWVNCMVGATPANVNLTIQASVAIGACTIDWGDGTAPEPFPGGIPAMGNVSHMYPSAIDTYLVVITQAAPFCVIQGHFVNEREVLAGIILSTGGVTTFCAPDSITFLNTSQNVSKTTVFTVDFGDGTAPVTLPWTNANQIIGHRYNRRTVSCNTNVTITARNMCSGSVASSATISPVRIWDLDSAIIGSNKTTLCYPDTTVTFTNNTIRNCLGDGNTQQRYERWVLHDFKGTGVDSIINWRPWPPSTPITIGFPGGNRPRAYTVTMYDSSFCGIDSASRTIMIIDPPVASFTSADTICGGLPLAFTNTSSAGFSYAWSFGDGGTSATFSPSHTYTNTTNAPVNQTVRLIVTNGGAFACRDTAIKVVTILPQPTPQFTMNGAAGTGAISGCDSLEVLLADNASTNATQWDWDFDNNGTIDYSGPTPPARKFYTTTTVRLTVTSANGCTNSRTRVINIYRTPVANYGVASVCVNQVASFSDSSIQFAGNNITSRAWNFGDPASGANNTSTSVNPTHIFAAPGSYDVRLVLNSANGCRDTIIKTLIVQFPPTADFTPSVTSGCSPLSVSFLNGSVNADPAFYKWSIGSSTSTQVSPATVFLNNGTTNDTIRVKLVAQTTFGCKDSIVKTIIVFPNPRAGFTANAFPSCTPSPIGFINTSTGAISYEWDFDDGSTSTLPGPIHQFNNTSNFIRTYNVRLIATSANTCKDTATMPVLVYPDQTFTVTTNVDSGCSPLSVQFPSFPAVVSYDWDFGDTQQSNDPAPRHTYVNNTQNPVVYTARAILTNAFGCRDTVFKSIKVFPIPTAFFTVNSVNGCQPFTVTFSNISTGATSFHWDYGDGTNETTTSTTTQKSYENLTDIPVQRTVTLTASNPNGCSAVDSKVITVYPRLKAAFTIDTVSCSPFVFETTNTSHGAQKYYWFLDNSLVDSSFNKLFSITNNSTVARTYTITLRSVSAYGCSDDSSMTVRVLPTPVAGFNLASTAGCQPYVVNITNTSTGGTFFHWDYGDGTDETTTSMITQHQFDNPTDIPLQRMITLTAYNNDTCFTVHSQMIQVFPRLRAAFNIDTLSCSPYVFQATNTSIGAQKYYWYLDGSLVDSLYNQTFTISNTTGAPEIHTIRLQVVSAFGCTLDSSMNVRVLPTPTASFITDVSSGCEPLTVTYTNLSTPGANYLWDFGNGDEPIVNPSFQRIYSNSTRLPVVYTTQLVAVNPEGCIDTVHREITVFPAMNALFSLPDTAGCSPFTFRPQNQSTNTINYAWYVDNVLIDTASNPLILIENTGSSPRVYTIRLDAGSAYGCNKTYTRTVTVYPSPVADFVVPNPTIKFPLNTFGIINQNIQPGLTYHWDFGDNTTSVQANPGTHTYADYGVYTITLAVSNALCSDTLRRVVTIDPPLPIVNFNGSGAGCAPFVVQFVNNTRYATHYNWEFGDNTSSTEANPYHVYTSGGTYTVRLTAIGAGGQAVAVHIDSVTVYDRPTAYFVAQPRTVYIPSDPVVLFNLSTNSESYLWTFGDGNSSTEKSPEHYYQLPGDYTIRLIAENEFDCKDTFSVVNAVRAEGAGKIVVPNAFTPNPFGPSGGHIIPGRFDNDVFHPVVSGAEQYYLSIYNRWGQLMFESRDVHVGWDGYFRGELCKQDVYVWKVEAKFSDGTSITKAGDLLLLR